MLTFLHVFGACVWFGTAVTLPFWGNRMNRASHLQVVLDIMNTVYILKCVFIMGGLTLTLVSGAVLTQHMGLPFFDTTGVMAWLGYSQWLALLIAFNSVVLLYLMTRGRMGWRSHFRYVPFVGYNNIGLILLVLIQMAIKPTADEEVFLLFVPFGLILLADTAFIVGRIRHIRRLRSMPAQAFADYYFGLLKDENMTDFFRLFHDDIVFVDPFATGPVKGIKALERFFQELGDQFDEIDITPVQVEGDTETIRIQWEAHGVTKNGIPMSGLRGSNVMERVRGKIRQVTIKFDVKQLPPVQLVKV